MTHPFSPAQGAREVGLAETRIRRYIRETPLEPSPFLSRETGAEVYLKLECVQVTGSFKARGAFNKLLSLGESDRARGVVAASTGNHGLATAYALAVLGIAGEIFLPSRVSPAKLDGLRARGARVRLVDEDPGVVETVARQDAERTGRIYLSPYNDPEVIGGQDDWIVVGEDALRSAIRLVLERQSVLIEGAAALPVAGLLAARARLRGGRVALVLSGSHIGLPTLAEVLRDP